jgi:hypothetical protein
MNLRNWLEQQWLIVIVVTLLVDLFYLLDLLLPLLFI